MNPATPRLVIDTQVALDLLVFGDPTVERLRHALRDRTAQWLVAPGMRREFVRVATAAFCARWQADPDRALAQLDAWTVPVADPSASGAAVPLCSDPDDQVFIDLACSSGAQALISRDKAVLALGRTLQRRFGVRVMHPRNWSTDLSALRP